MDRSMTGYYVMMDYMSPDDGTAMKYQWKMHIMDVINNDL